MNHLCLRLCFLCALLATLGSLFFSEILNLPPCSLCWYQRIFMYPLLFIFGSALWTADGGFLKYTLPLTIIGAAIAVYHNLLYYGWIADSLVGCAQGVSCTSRQVEWNSMTIPLLSFVSFVILLALQVASIRTREIK